MAQEAAAASVDVVVTGADAAALAEALHWPALPDAGAGNPGAPAFGFRGLPRAAATLRVLGARKAITTLGLTVVLEGPGAED
jgi:hypothetical protein